MKIEEIMPALRAGKKIRRKCWYDFLDIRVENGNCFLARNGKNAEDIWDFMNSDDLLATDWEVVE